VNAAEPCHAKVYKENYPNFELIREEVIYSTHQKRHHNLIAAFIIIIFKKGTYG